MSIYVGDLYPIHTGFGDSISSLYNLYVDFNYSDVYLTTSGGAPIADEDGITLTISDPAQPVDRVSRLNLITDGLAAGRVSYDGVTVDQDEPVIGERGLLTYGAFTCLNGMTNDISDVYWSKSNVNTPAADEFQATTQFGLLFRNINTTDSALYTLSFYVRVESGGNTTGYKFAHIDSASGNNTDLTLTETRKRHEVTILGKTGGGSVTFGFRDDNLSNWSKVYIDTINITESAYLLPPVINNTTAPLAIPENNSASTRTIGFPINEPYDPTLSDDESAWNRCRQNLINAFDGVADGEELVDDSITFFPGLGSGWVNNGDGTYTCDGSQTANSDLVSGSLLGAGEKYENIFEVISVTTGSIRPYMGGAGAGDFVHITGENTQRITQGGASLSVIYRASSDFVGTVRPISVKQISPAQGQLEWQGQFGFDYDQADNNNYSLFSVKNSNVEVIQFKNFGSNDGRIRAYDGVLIADALAVNWQANTPYTAILKYGPHPDFAGALKMQLSVTDGTTTWDSAVVDFDGSFDPAEFLNFCFSNPYPVWTKSLKIKKEVTW